MGRDALLERKADRAREELAANVSELDERARHAADIADAAELTIRRHGAILAVASGAAVALVIGAAARPFAAVIGRAVLGAAAGLGAGAAMNQVHRVWSTIESKLVGPSAIGSEAEPRDPATVQAAEAIVGPLDDDVKPRAGAIAHWVMSAVTGAVYGVVGDLPLVRSARGLAYGAAVWLIADEIAVPALGFAPGPARVPARVHARALLAHLVYGAALDAGVRAVQRALRLTADSRS
jgi:hypothetical protein